MLRLLPLLACALLCGCTTLQPAPTRTHTDHDITKHLVKEMTALREAGELTSSDILAEQLKRQRHSLQLPVSATGSAQDPAELYARSEAGVIIVANLYKCGRCERWHTNAASGFIIHSDGIAVTNYHVIENERENMLGAMTVDGRTVAISEVLAANKESDIAVIKLAGDNFTALPLSQGDPVGTPVIVISHPVQRFYTLSTGIISRYFTTRKPGTHSQRMSITADFAKGSSGAPVINPYGEVTGVVSSTSSIYYNKKEGVDVNLQMVIKSCIPAQAIRDLLKVD
jgi:serine protease Do